MKHSLIGLNVTPAKNLLALTDFRGRCYFVWSEFKLPTSSTVVSSLLLL